MGHPDDGLNEGPSTSSPHTPTPPPMTERSQDALRDILQRIDGRGYKAYKELKGSWQLPLVALHIDHVQGDPFAAPSRLRVHLPGSVTRLPPEVLTTNARRWGTSCLLARAFQEETHTLGSGKGSGRSGEIRMEAPGQQVIPNTAVQLAPDGSVEARFRVGLPARGRRVLGQEALRLLLEVVPDLVERTLLASAHSPEEVLRHAEMNEDADVLRDGLARAGLVAFVANGARLPRRSGVDDRPLEGSGVVPFQSPPELEVTLETPNAGPVTGMGIPQGVTLIVGGGYHGKSTLLRALERGVYNHRPGDGRERVVSDPDAVKIRAEDGRPVTSVNISPFIGRLPGGVDTRDFSTSNASGSTSQAAAIVEALESGATTLLMDEDTSATNFMIRDRRMQILVPGDREPITPFVDRVRELHRDLEISSILVLGGSGDYLDVADTVVAMNEYQAEWATDRGKEVARNHPTGRTAETPTPLTDGLSARPARRPLQTSVDPSRGKRPVRIRVRGEDQIQFGRHDIDLSAVEQIVSWAQARALSEGLLLARDRFMSPNPQATPTLSQILDGVMEALAEEGLDVLGHGHDGDLALFRRHELAAALNRLRPLTVAPPGEGLLQEPR